MHAESTSHIRDSLLRPRLLRQLTHPRRAPITLISAPAGYGKSTLAQQWAERYPHPVAWLELTPVHNTAARFLEDVCMALIPDADQGVPDLDAVLARLRLMADRQPGSMLVLDDLHVIESREVLNLLQTLVATLPAGLHLLLLSRTTPSVSLARYRLKGQVRELTAADLGFTMEEVRKLVARAPVQPLPEHALTELTSRSEGWIAGIQLALSSLQRIEEPGGTSGIDFWLTQDRLDDYVVEEVLGTLPEDLRHFVLKTAILPHLDPALCDAVLESETSAARVADVDRQLRFVRPIDPASATLRYHALFAECAMRIADRNFPASERRQRHLRAARWFADRGQPEHALDQAIQAEAWDLARECARVVGRDLMQRDHSASRLYWLRKLPEEHIISDPELARWYISALQYTGHIRHASDLLVQVAPLWEASSNPVHHGYLASSRSFLASIEGRVDDWLQESYRALHLYPLAAVVERLHLWTGIMQAEFHRGNHGLAAEAHRQASVCRDRLPADQVWAAQIDYNFANQMALRGDLRAAIDLYRERLNQLPVWLQGQAPQYHARLASLHLERAELDDAAAYAELTMKGLDSAPEAVWHAEVLLIVAQVAAARSVDASHALNRADEMTVGRSSSAIRRQIDAMRTTIWLDGGQNTLASMWAASARHDGPRRLGAFGDVDPRQVVARALIATGQAAEARAYLEPFVVEAREAQRWSEQVGLLVWLMVACLRGQQQAAALAALREALQHGMPGGFVRTFLPPGVDVRPFYRSAQRLVSAPEAAYLGRLLERLDGGAPSMTSRLRPAEAIAPAPPLSPRERDVLRLLCDGASNRDIAERLFITERTVKKHMSNLMHKLGVPNRTAAVLRARELGLSS